MPLFSKPVKEAGQNSTDAKKLTVHGSKTKRELASSKSKSDLPWRGKQR